MYRMGDFYEMFFEDARQAAPLLEVQLTARQKGTDNEAPMCGIPHHALDSYLGKLLEAGLRVAICDQVEDPKEAKGLVRREVTRIVTPGTISDPGLLDGKEENLLASLVWEGEGGAGAFLDISTGSFFVRRWPGEEEAVGDLALLRPREALLAGGRLSRGGARLPRPRVPLQDVRGSHGDRLLDLRRSAELLGRQFGTATLRGFGLAPDEPAVRAAAAALAYAQSTQKSDLAHVRGIVLREPGDRLIVDATTLANLEVFKTQREGRKRGTLLSVLDRTVTAPGGRLLRDWLHRPLRDPAAIAARHEAVAELAADNPRRERLRDWPGADGRPRAPPRPRRSGHPHPARGRGSPRHPGPAPRGARRGGGRERRGRPAGAPPREPGGDRSAPRSRRVPRPHAGGGARRRRSTRAG